MQTKALQMKRALRIALIVLLLSVIGKGFSQDFTVGNLNYSINTDGTSVTVTGHVNGTSATGSLVIPESVSYGGHSYAVTAIGEFAFYNCRGLTGSLIIPNSVTEIGGSAFVFCNGFTGSLTIGNSVTKVGDGAFSDCNGFTGNLIIPNSVTSIESGAFSYCTGLTGDLVIPNSVTSIESGAFRGCSGFTGTLTIPNSVTSISSEVFYGCSGFTGSLIIPNSATSIGRYAFDGCSGFTSLTIGNSVTSIDNNAFYNCSGISEVYYNAVNCGYTYNSRPFEGCGGTLTIGNNVESIPVDMFYGANFTGSLTIPNSVTSIGDRAFNYCNFDGLIIDMINIPSASYNSWIQQIGGSDFTGTLTIGNSVVTIGDKAFQNCTGFTGNLIIGNSVTTIGDEAFQDCTGFTGNLTFPNSVTTIGDNAFSGCSGLGAVYYTGDIVQWCNIPFSNSSSNPLSNAHNLYINNELVTNLVIPESVTEIKDYAFYGCSGITGSLTFSNSVTAIGKEAFAGCSGFTGVYYSGNIAQWCNINFAITNNTVTSNPLCWAHNLYINNNLVTDLVIPESVTMIKNLAFYGCTCITRLTLPASVTEIGFKTFNNCSGLTAVDYYATNCSSNNTSLFPTSPIVTVNIGENVQTIPSDAFKDCTTLNTIIALRATPPTLGANAFTNISPVAILLVPCGSQMAYFSNWNIFAYNNIHEECTPRPVSVDSNITGGSVIPSVSQALMGQEVLLSIMPNPGMGLASITAYNTNNPSQIVPISPIGNSYKFVMLPYAVTVSATFESTNSLLEENLDNITTVYPNPTSSHVTIQAENLQHITINNPQGQVLYESKASGNEFQYDFDKHDAGLYLIRIETANGVAVKKVSVVR